MTNLTRVADGRHERESPADCTDEKGIDFAHMIYTQWWNLYSAVPSGGFSSHVHLFMARKIYCPDVYSVQ